MKKHQHEKAISGLRSECCGAKVIILNGRPDFSGRNEVATSWYVCTKCNQDCNLKKRKEIKKG
jgi:hypothetical protein